MFVPDETYARPCESLYWMYFEIALKHRIIITSGSEHRYTHANKCSQSGYDWFLRLSFAIWFRCVHWYNANKSKTTTKFSLAGCPRLLAVCICCSCSRSSQFNRIRRTIYQFCFYFVVSNETKTSNWYTYHCLTLFSFHSLSLSFDDVTHFNWI